jgi:uncharacterized protein GlcG (DUF336 family)
VPRLNTTASIRLALSAVAIGCGFSWLPGAQPRAQISPPAQLSQTDVTAILAAGASALSDAGLAIAVVDRSGTILGVYRRPQAAATTPDVAVSLARTGAFFSNDQAPLSSRTVRFISGIHFPPGVSNTANAALYGIENTNRGCQIDEAGDAVFSPGQLIPRPRSIAGTFSSLAGQLPAACNPATSQGCAVGGPIARPGGASYAVGITTGKADLLDSAAPLAAPVNPGGLPLYRQGRVIGGVGVAGVSPDRAEFAAAVAAAGTRSQTGITTGLTFPDPPLPTPGAVFIDGIRLPFFDACIDFACVQGVVDNRPAGSSPGGFSSADILIPSTAFPAQAARAAPEGYLIGPFASAAAGGLTEADVRQIVEHAIARANVTRAQIRLPLGSTTRMVISVSDRTGRILAAYRMPDATVFSLDVALTKARNAFYFSTREGYEILRGFVDRNPYTRYEWTPEPPTGKGWAITNRTLSFGGQPLFPPGIDLDKAPTPGPWFDLFTYDSDNPCTEGPGASRGGNRQYAAQTGVVWFPGSAPLYRDGVLVGGVGVSGDGVEQDDYVTAAAAGGFEPPDDLRVDRSAIRTGRGEEVRLPYFKFPRNPEAR